MTILYSTANGLDPMTHGLLLYQDSKRAVPGSALLRNLNRQHVQAVTVTTLTARVHSRRLRGLIRIHYDMHCHIQKTTRLLLIGDNRAATASRTWAGKLLSKSDSELGIWVTRCSEAGGPAVPRRS